MALSISEPFQPVSSLKKWLLGCCSSTETIPDRAASQGQLGVLMKLQDAVKAFLMAASDIYLSLCTIQMSTMALFFFWMTSQSAQGRQQVFTRSGVQTNVEKVNDNPSSELTSEEF